MEPGTPFALLAAVQLFSVACCLSAAGGWFLPVLRCRRSSLIALGAAVLAAAETASGVALGSFASHTQIVVRVAAGAVLFAGAFGRGRPRALLTLGALVVMADGALGSALDKHPDALLSGRAIAGVLLAASVISGVRRSLLGKVVAAIMIGVVVTSMGASIVSGTALSRTFGRQQASQVASVATSERTDLLNLRQQALPLAQVFAYNITPNPKSLAGFLRKISADRGFAVQVLGPGNAVALDDGNILDAAALVDLSNTAIVQKALTTKGFVAAPDFLVVRGKQTHLLAVGVAAARPGLADNQSRPPFAAVYAIPIDVKRLTATVDRNGVNVSLLAIPDGGVLASSLTGVQLSDVISQAKRRLAHPPAERSIESVRSNGGHPATGYALLQSATEPLALLVASQSADVVSKTQKLVLAGLFGALVGIAVILAGIALLLGRRLVDPIQRLTNAATAVRLGNTEVRVATEGRDEVGELSRAFDEMTSSLVLATDQLRVTADEEALVRARLQTVLDAMVNALLVIDRSGEVVQANPAATALLGYDPHGEKADAVLVNPAGESLLKQSGGVHELDVGADPIPVVFTVTSLPRNAGRVVVLRDVSAEREVERLKTEFLSNVSHELRTPLTPIKGYAELLARRDLDIDKVRSFAGTILTSTQRMTRVVDLLVDVAALDAGRIKPTARPTALGQSIDDAIARWRRYEPARAKDLRRRVTRGVPEALVDGEWLGKALDEVVGNAIKFSRPGSLVTISAEPAPRKSHVRITVRDRGLGMADHVIAEALSDFSQADGSATRRAEGLGLGLGFCRRVADVIGMSIAIESEEGKGTAVHLDLPVAKGRKAAK